MTDYIYAPKDDPLHRERWRDPYPDDELRRFEQLVEDGTLRVGFGISPGLSIDYESTDDRGALATKIDRMLAAGVGLVCLALDDIPPRPGLGRQHAALTTWLAEHLGEDVPLVLVPTEYTGTGTTAYLDDLAAGVPEQVPIAWTGRTVVCDTISRSDAAARAASLGGRRPLIWDNYPVNDTIMADRLFIGPLRGRDHDLDEECSGYVANPMVQPNASKLPLASIAGYLQGDDPGEVWTREADALGVTAFAEACDGRRPRELVRRLITATDFARGNHLESLRRWIDAAGQERPDDWMSEVGPWRDQLDHELGLCRAALRLLAAVADGDLAKASEEALGLAYLWPAVRRAPVTVMGPRCSFRPVISQGDDGSWRYERAALEEDANATDALVRHALQTVADAPFRFFRQSTTSDVLD